MFDNPYWYYFHEYYRHATSATRVWVMIEAGSHRLMGRQIFPATMQAMDA